jgi:hypothetical protein
MPECDSADLAPGFYAIVEGEFIRLINDDQKRWHEEQGDKIVYITPQPVIQ